MNWPTNKLGEANTKVLILAKSLYLHGCDFAKSQDEINRLLAVHAFDNAVEIMLKAIATKKNIQVPSGKKDWGFYDLTDKVAAESQYKIQIEGLHEQRNRAQHHADVPDFSAVSKYQGYVGDYIKESLENDFGISFDDLSRAVLIKNEELRKKVKEAENAFTENNYQECLLACQNALSMAVFDISDIFTLAGELSGHFAGKEFAETIKETYPQKFKGGETHLLAKSLKSGFIGLGQAVTAMQFFDSLRIDFLKHQRAVKNIDNLSREELKEEARSSINFVLNLLMKWQGEGVL